MTSKNKNAMFFHFIATLLFAFWRTIIMIKKTAQRDNYTHCTGLCLARHGFLFVVSCKKYRQAS